MKALSYIAILILPILNSCSSTLYTGAEYDDLYYSASDKPVVKKKTVVYDQVAEKELRANTYNDSLYSADTLITDKFSLPSDYDDQIVVNNSSMPSGSGYDYYDDSYSNRINMFYGNSFYPYWHDPFYFSFGFNYGYPYYGLGFGFGFGYGSGYGYGYPYYGDPWYGGYYPYYPYYGYGGGYYPYYPYYGDAYGTSYGRRERPSSMSSKWNDNLGMGGSGRRSTDGTAGGYSTTGRRSYSGNQALTTDARRSAAGSISGAAAKTNQDAIKGESATARSASSSQRSQGNTKPEYKSANRTYTPSYNNPRMSTRPSYNNSRVSDGSGSSVGQGNNAASGSRNYGNTSTVRNSASRVFNQNSGSGQRANSFSNMQRRYSSPASTSKQYSVPSRRSVESSGRSYSSGSYGGSSYSGGGSSSSGSRSSYSSGSSSSGSSGGGRSSSSTHSSGGRR